MKGGLAMKQFFSANLSNMTFIFSFIILLNAILGNLGDFNKLVLYLAAVTLILTILSYGISYINFHLEWTYHIVQLSFLFSAFLLLGHVMKLISFSLENILVNGIVFSIVYFLTVRLRKQQLNQLADAINEQLGDRK